MTAHPNANPSDRPVRAGWLVLLGGILLALVTPVALPSGVLSPAAASPPPHIKLTAAEGSADAKFGTGVSISGNTAVVGAPDEGGAGAAYVFTKNAGTWVERATLVAPVRAAGAKFGYSVAISGDTIVVGASNADQTPTPDQGAAYVYARKGDAWPLQAQLSASDGGPDDAFGFAVAIWRDTIVVGAMGSHVAPSADPGAAYVFSRSGEVWSEQAKLTPGDGAPYDWFGYSVSAFEDTVVVGVVQDDVGAAVDQGSVRVFTREGPKWTEQATLTATDGSPGDGFGNSTSIYGHTVVTGAVADDLAEGSAYVFTRVGREWSPGTKLTAPPSDRDPGDQFGRFVAVTDDNVAVGAHFDEPGGSVFVFGRIGPRWGAPTELKVAGTGLLGVSGAMSGHTVISGANFTAVEGKSAQGAAYVFDLRHQS